MQRKTGPANGTTNGFYTVSSGFTMLDTFRNNTANYFNNASSFPTIDLAFGSNSNAVPEPASGVMAVIFFGGAAVRQWRKKNRKEASVSV